MNDWWNDPPEVDEGPMCPECRWYGDYLTGNQATQMFGCEECGHRWLIPVAADYGPEDFDYGPEDFDYVPANRVM
jgi:hypothetical protein